MTALLDVSNLSVRFPVMEQGIFRRQVSEMTAVNKVSFSLPQGGNLGIVGESGSGKTTLVRAILRALDPSEGAAIFQSQHGAVDLCPAESGSTEASPQRNANDLSGPLRIIKSQNEGG